MTASGGTSMNHAANPGRHSLAARKDDLYETPPDAVRTLLKVESLPESIWEPDCGPGSIVGNPTGGRADAVDFSEAIVAEAKAKVPLGARPRSSV